MKFIVCTVVGGGSLYDIFANGAAVITSIPTQLAAYGTAVGSWAGSILTIS